MIKERILLDHSFCRSKSLAKLITIDVAPQFIMEIFMNKSNFVLNIALVMAGAQIAWPHLPSNVGLPGAGASDLSALEVQSSVTASQREDQFNTLELINADSIKPKTKDKVQKVTTVKKGKPVVRAGKIRKSS